jgi:trehalose 6-phosphate phosphatase
MSEPNTNANAESAFDSLVRRTSAILAKRPSALVTDIDGTISPISSTPAAAVIIPEARHALLSLSTILPLVAIVTGRASEDAERMLGLDDILYIGNHGFERRWQGETRDHSSGKESQAAIEQSLNRIERDLKLEELDQGILLENKRLSGAVHYRLAPARDLIGPRLGAIVRRASEDFGLRMTEGRYVFELRPPITVNKGTAILDLIEDHDLRGIVFFGDDMTDVDAFREIRRASNNGIVDGLTIAVNAPEVRPEVIEGADAVVEGVPGAVALLVAIAAQMEKSKVTDAEI